MTVGDQRDVVQGQDRVAWRDLPERYAPWKTVYNRFWRWTRNGTLPALVGMVGAIAEPINELDRDELDRDLAWEVPVDSSIVRAHQPAAGARKANTILDATGMAATPPSSPGGGRVLRRAERAR